MTKYCCRCRQPLTPNNGRLRMPSDVEMELNQPIKILRIKELIIDYSEGRRSLDEVVNKILELPE